MTVLGIFLSKNNGAKHCFTEALLNNAFGMKQCPRRHWAPGKESCVFNGGNDRPLINSVMYDNSPTRAVIFESMDIVLAVLTKEALGPGYTAIGGARFIHIEFYPYRGHTT
jgi:hypothetical protein